MRTMFRPMRPKPINPMRVGIRQPPFRTRLSAGRARPRRMSIRTPTPFHAIGPGAPRGTRRRAPRLSRSPAAAPASPACGSAALRNPPAPTSSLPPRRMDMGYDTIPEVCHPRGWGRSNMAEVHLKGIRKSYESNVVIENLDLEVRDQEFMVLVGPSGCGKSTALRMIAGLEEVTGGTITIGGRVVNDVPPKDRDIAMVFQSYALYPHMTVRENLEFGLKIRKTPRDEMNRRVQEAADILGITELMERKPKQLSGGQQRGRASRR